jgi:mannose-6-phosphate isomerase-like protein (cupin superfamily)
MEARVVHAEASTEYFYEEGCWIQELLNQSSQPDLSIARARVAPGQRTRWHALADTAERYVVTAGTGLVEVGDLPPTAVGPGDVVTIPPGCRQRISNTGATDLIFLAVCTPRFVPESYRDLGDY